MNDFDCPRCTARLVLCSNEFGNFWHCGDCGGTAVTVSLLRKFVERDAVNVIWRGAKDWDHLAKLECPGCDARMEEVPVETPHGQRMIDVCERCQFIWLDEGEWDDLPHAPVEGDGRVLSPEAKEAIAVARIEQLRKNHDFEYNNVQTWLDDNPRQLLRGGAAGGFLGFLLALLNRRVGPFFRG